MKKIVYMLALFLVLTFAASGVVSGAGEQISKAGAGEAICDGPGGACIIADFIGSPTDGVAPLRVQFLDSSTGYPTMWNWDFGDGNVASGTANPVHIYSEPGIYTVSLTATSITGATSTKVRQRYIIVRDKYPLEADFLANPTYGKAPLHVQFTDCSKGAVEEWKWDFGDGGTAYEQNPSHVYQRPGKYTVTLTVSSPTAGTSTKVKEKYIIVEPSCIIEARFRADPTSGAAPLTVKFTDLSVGGPTMWAWDFGDGTTDMVANPTHVYKNPGTYQVRLTASSQTCESGVSETTIKVNPPAIKADFSADPRSGEAPLTVQFTDLSTGNPTMWNWDFGDGTIIPASEDEEVACEGGRCPPPNTLKNPRHTYRVPGTYTVTLTASNQYSSDTVTKTQFVTVTPRAIKADFSADPRSGDAPLTVRFTDLSTGNPTMWAWDFGDGATDMVANPTHVYTTPGTYSVTLTASNQYTSDTVCKTQWVTVRDVSINADFVGNPTSGYAPLTVQFTDLSTGNPTKWLWDFGDGGIIPASEEEEVTCEGGRCPPPNTLQNPRHTYRLPGTYTVTLTASNQYGTSDTEVKQAYITVTANAIVADFDGTPRSGCAPLTVQFTDKSSDSPTMWNWDFGDGGIIPASTEENVTCEGGACPPPNTLQNPRHTYTVPGTYTVTLTASNQFGATGTVTKQAFITVESCPAIKADFDGVPRSGEAPLTVSFTDRSSGNPTMWAWDFGDGATDMIANPVHTYTKEGKYTVTLTASSKYGSDTVSKSEFITVNTPYDDLIPVSGGWNFISVPKKLAPGYDTASIFKVIDSGGHSMFQYDTGKHLWHTLDPSSPIKPLEGFWIYSKGTSSVPIRYDTNPVQTPPTAYLKKGWNGIGFTGTTPIEAKFTLLSVQDKWVNCAGFNAAAQQYDPMIIKGSNDATLMYPFRGYWLYMTADGVLAANAA
ncbi:PKD domain-containing protein [Methanospirillum hungatei]|uniref:PKD domain-containing protein n=1 Tax=Methanospirillum hungatei TaxID=2203 RepID=UPI0026F332C3|nr:PKD domain-containing protein [Methanospirillum hungatei]